MVTGLLALFNNDVLRPCREIVGRWGRDNSPIHTSNIRRQGLAEQSIITLLWRKESPDVKIIENLWGIMATMFGAHGKNYINLEELNVAIEIARFKVRYHRFLKPS